jgi:hypothetical protein
VFFAPQALVAGTFLAALANFHRAPISAVLVPVVRALAGDDAAHYPQFYVELPILFDSLGALAHGFISALGWTAFLVAVPDLFGHEEPDGGDAWRKARRLLPRVWAVTVPLALLQWVAALVVLGLERGSLGESPRMMSVAQFAAFAVVSLAQILSAYALPAIVLGGLSASRAWARSWSLSTHHFLITTGFVLAPRLLEIPVRRAIEEIPSFWESVDPESVVGALALLAAVSIAATLVSLGALARFHLHKFGLPGETS